MKSRTFATAQDCEAAFYEALERNDLDAMMEVWAEDEEVVCVHPGGPRLSGYEQVRASWSQIFRAGQRLKFRLTGAVSVQGMMVAIHSVHEQLSVQGENAELAPVVATNVYLRTAGGWRMVVHHASPVPGAVRAETPAILH